MSSRFPHRPLHVTCNANEDDSDQGNGDLAVAPAKPKLKRPPLYRVILLNDDYTPMEFVVQVLEQFFDESRKSDAIMLAGQYEGKAYVEYIRRILLKGYWSTSQPERADIRYCAPVEPSTDDEGKLNAKQSWKTRSMRPSTTGRDAMSSPVDTCC